MVAILVLLVLAGPAAPPDPSALVAQLGSARAAERAAAAAALEQMGPEAVSALREVRQQARDLELRARAAALLDAIEGRAIARPTLVTLDFQDRSIAEVVAAVADRSKTELVLEPESDDRWKTQRISLEATAPLPFWEALDRLCREAGLQLLVGPEATGFRRPNRFAPGGPVQPRQWTGQELFLVADDGHGAPPVSSSGAIQVALLALHHQRDRVFVSNLPGRAAPGATVRFYVRIQVRIEPRLSFLWVGVPDRLEAIDDLGQSLPPESLGAAPRPPFQVAPPLAFQPGGMAPRSGSLEFALKYPERPGKTIERLKGTLPVRVAGRRPEPLVVPLEGSRDQVFRSGETTLVIHDVKALPDRRGAAVELTLTAPDLTSPGANPIWTDARAGLRPPPLTLPQLDFVDERGRICQSFAPGPYRLGDGTRKTLQVIPPEGIGPPVEVRYHEIMWTTVEVPFAFEDLPMP